MGASKEEEADEDYNIRFVNLLYEDVKLNINGNDNNIKRTYHSSYSEWEFGREDGGLSFDDIGTEITFTYFNDNANIEFKNTYDFTSDNHHHIVIFAGNLVGSAVDINNLSQVVPFDAIDRDDIGVTCILFLAIFTDNFSEEVISYDEVDEEYVNFLNNKNDTKNISMGDLLHLLPLLSTSSEESQFNIINLYSTTSIVLNINDEPFNNNYTNRCIFKLTDNTFTYTDQDSSNIFENTIIGMTNGLQYTIVFFAGQLANVNDTEANIDNLNSVPSFNSYSNNSSIIENKDTKLILAVFVGTPTHNDIKNFLSQKSASRRDAYNNGSTGGSVYNNFKTFITLKKV